MVRLDELTDPQFEEHLSALYLMMLRLGRPTRKNLIEAGADPDDLERSAGFLESRQLITRLERGVWDVQPPEVALPRLAGLLEQRARSTRNSATELGVLWRQVRREPALGDLQGVEVLRSVDQVVLAAYALAASAGERVRILLDDSPVARRLLLEEPDTIGVAPVSPSAVSLAVDVSLFAHDGVLPRLEAAVARGHRVVVGVGHPFSGLVVDDAAGLVDLSRHDPRADGSFVVRRPGPVAAIAALFEVAHDMSTPMGPTIGRGTEDEGQPPLVERDRRVLSLLSAGATDQQIARSINVSTRTVERRVASLMSTLGAATRFQAGVQAARRGWL